MTIRQSEIFYREEHLFEREQWGRMIHAVNFGSHGKADQVGRTVRRMMRE